MKRISHLLLLSVFLASCGNAVTPIPNVTVTSKVTVTYTPMPSNTPEPTATKDPMADAPAGATGQETIDGKTVFYKLGADGKTHNYDTGFKTPEGEVIWASSHIKNPTFKGGMPSYDEPGFGLEPGMRIDFKVKEGINAPYIQHVTNENFKGGLTYSVNAMDTLMSRYYGKMRGQISTEELRDFYNNIFPNEFSVSLTDAQGNPHTIDANTSFTIILVDPADIPNPDFQLPKKTPNILSFTIFDDEARTVTILVANTKPIDQLSDYEFMETLLYQYGHILVFDDLSMGAWWADSGKAMRSGSFFNMSLKGDPPYFTLSDSP